MSLSGIQGRMSIARTGWVCFAGVFLITALPSLLPAQSGLVEQTQPLTLSPVAAQAESGSVVGGDSLTGHPTPDSTSLSGNPVIATAPSTVPFGADANLSGPEACGTHCGTSGLIESSPSSLESVLCSDQRLLDCLQGTHCVEDVGRLSYEAGVQVRYRLIDEHNRLRPLGLVHQNYQQWRIIPFIRLSGGDDWHVMAEGIDASHFGEEAVALPIDVNRADLLQAYVDFRLTELEGGDVRFRYGRQVLKYGNQHLVSPLDWSNTRRNFEGYKLYYQGQDWNVDAFAVQPVNFIAGLEPQLRSFDTPNENIWFSGVYSTYKGYERSVVDFYWLWYRNSDPLNNLANGDRHTIGARWEKTDPVLDRCGQVDRTWWYEVEGGYQFGTDQRDGVPDLDVQAGYLSAVAEHRWSAATWSPTVKGLFWMGTGDTNAGNGTTNTMFTLYPLGHAYWGLIDNFSGQNLMDYSVQASVKPTSKLSLLAAWHWFDKFSTSDNVYNIGGVALGPTTGPRNIGNELDLLATYKVNANLTVQGGVFWFMYGDAVTQTALDRSDAHFYYFMSTWNF